jgi:phage head maturation protease
MSVKLNKTGDSHARSLIAAGKIDVDSPWSFSADDGNELLGGADGDDWDNYAKWHLAEDTDATDETKAHWKYPFGKDGKVYRRALIAIEGRATTAGASSVSAAAKALLKLVDKKSGKDDDKDEGRSLRRLPMTGTHTRFADTVPSSYDKKARTVDAVLSMGSPVKRFYGVEVLRIDPDSVNLDRIVAGGVPLLDSHNAWGISGALGRVQKAWFDRGALMGRLGFNDTEQGRLAEGMVSRGEISGISVGYKVEDWEITDAEGDVIDPETDRIRWDDDNLTFTAINWQLLEASLVTVPADATAAIRSAALLADEMPLPGMIRVVKRAGGSMSFEYEPASDKSELEAIRGRMRSRQTMLNRGLIIGR